MHLPLLKLLIHITVVTLFVLVIYVYVSNDHYKLNHCNIFFINILLCLVCTEFILV